MLVAPGAPRGARRAALAPAGRPRPWSSCPRPTRGRSRAGGTFALRLLYRGKPLAGALVKAFPKDGNERRLSARTDAQGRVRFVLPEGGIWLISAVHMIDAPAASGARWESLWSSLTFEVAGARRRSFARMRASELGFLDVREGERRLRRVVAPRRASWRRIDARRVGGRWHGACVAEQSPIEGATMNRTRPPVRRSRAPRGASLAALPLALALARGRRRRAIAQRLRQRPAHDRRAGAVPGAARLHRDPRRRVLAEHADRRLGLRRQSAGAGHVRRRLPAAGRQAAAAPSAAARSRP